MKTGSQWTRKDIGEISIALLIIVISTLRSGPPKEAAVDMLRHLWAYAIYSIATVLIIIGLTKKMFKYKPTWRQMVKWAVFLAAFCAVTQFMHETFLMLTGQGMP
ncbi:MAG: hypothetical protein ACP5J5_05060 [Dissulfurimicrobium sp.]|uniref:hypothetical protein n=1 Tax=Dissulfurimicrobium TaxID=1769732 RepID=UPI001EDC4F73|nr:hypothetical protein [Dissulfurimicrobium hydrothermale]UKL13749.1 hypothetical protein LGS26_00230 [Dissulfurimicrobium hydrothermale]